MATSFEIRGRPGFIRGILGRIRAFEQLGGGRLREATAYFLEELMAHTPVWSGRTVSSMTVSNDGRTRPKNGPPSRDNGRTNPEPTLPYPSPVEKRRPAAEAEARATLNQTEFTLSKPVYVTVDSPAWPLIQENKAPSPERARTKAYVIDRVVLEMLRLRYPFLR